MKIYLPISKIVTLIIVALIVAYSFIVATFQPQYGNPSIYSLHAYIYATEGNFYFYLNNDIDSLVKYEPGFHTILYVLLLSIFYKFFLFFDFFAENHSLIPKIFSIFIYSIIALVLNKIFITFKVENIFNRMLYILGFLSLIVVNFSILMPTMDPTLTALFLILVFYLFIKNDKVKDVNSIFMLLFLSILTMSTKETTGLIGLSFLFFYFTIIERRIAIKQSVIIFITALILTIAIHNLLSYFFDLNSNLILDAFNYHSKDRGFTLHHLFLYIKIVTILFTPLIYLILFKLSSDRGGIKLNILLMLIFIAMLVIYAKQGLTHPRYLLAFLPIIYVIVMLNIDKKQKISKVIYPYSIALIAYFYMLYPDMIISLSAFSKMSTKDIITSVFFYLLPFVVAIRFNLKEILIVFFIFNIYQIINYSGKSYMKYIEHGMHGYKESLSLIRENGDSKNIISDISGLEYYFRNRVLYPENPSNYYHSSSFKKFNSDKADILRLDAVKRTVNGLNFYLLTKKDSQLEGYVLELFTCVNRVNLDFTMYECN